MAGGCSAPPPKSAEKPPPKKDEVILPPSVHTGPATLTQFTDEPRHQRAWDAQWQTAEINYTRGEKPGGDMQEVTGTIYKDDQKVSTFSADRGHAEKGTGVLSLEGHVVVKSLDYGIALKSQTLVWDARTQLVSAKGGVSFEDKGYTLAGIPELWCSPDLKAVSTPDLYKKS